MDHAITTPNEKIHIVPFVSTPTEGELPTVGVDIAQTPLPTDLHGTKLQLNVSTAAARSIGYAMIAAADCADRMKEAERAA